MRSARAALPGLVLAAFLLAVGLQAAFSLPGVPFFDPDSAVYFFPHAAHEQVGRYLIHEDRQFLYPLVIDLAAGQARAYARLGLVQTALYLAGGLMLAAALWITARKSCGFSRPGALALAGLLFGALLLAKPSLDMAATLMPESLGGVYCGIMALATALYYAHGRKTGWLCLMAVTSALMFYVKPNIGLAVAYPAVLAAVHARRARWTGLALVAACLVLSLLALDAVQVHVFHGKKWSERTHGPATLFFWHLPGILEVIDDDLASGSATAYAPRELGQLRAYLGQELARQQGLEDHLKYPSLGYNPDHFLFGDTGISPVFARLGWDNAWQAAYYRHYFRAYVLAHPWRYAAKAGKELFSCYFMFEDRIGKLANRSFADLARQSRDSFRFILLDDYPCPDCTRSYIAGFEANWPEGPPENGYSRVYLALSQGLLRGLALAAGAGVLAAAGLCLLFVASKIRPGPPPDWLAPAAPWMALFLLVFLGDLTIALFHTFDIGRYLVPMLPLRLYLAFSLAMVAWAVIRSRGKAAPAS